MNQRVSVVAVVVRRGIEDNSVRKIEKRWEWVNGEQSEKNRLNAMKMKNTSIETAISSTFKPVAFKIAQFLKCNEDTLFPPPTIKNTLKTSI